MGNAEERSHRPPEPERDRIFVDRNVLLRTLSQLRSCESVPALRERAFRLLPFLQGSDASATLPLQETEPPQPICLSRRYLLDDWRQILEARTLERAQYYIERMIRGLTEVRSTEVNDINLNRWKEYDDILTDSLWLIERRDSSGAHSSDYWGNFVPQIPNQLMRRYTKQGDWVLDPFVGSGTTLIESQRLGRNGIGVELQPEVADQARRAIASEPNHYGVHAEVLTGDSAEADFASLLRSRGSEQAQLVIVHPPYHDIIRFSTDERDLSNAPSVEEFLERLLRVIVRAAAVLEAGRYLALVIGDKYSRGEWIPLGFLAMDAVLKTGQFALKSIVVKNFEGTQGKRQQQELWRYRALVGGFYVFKHEYIFLFRKRRCEQLGSTRADQVGPGPAD